MTSPRAERRLLFVTASYPPGRGGMSESCHRLVSTLRRLSHEVDVAVIGGAQGDELRSLQREGGRELLLPAGVHAATAFHHLVHHIRTFTGRPGQYHWTVAFGANLPGLLAVSLQAWLGLPAAVMVRGNDLDRDWFDPKRGLWVREALSRARVITAISREKQEIIRALFPGARVVFLPNGVDAGWWEPLPADLERARDVRARLDPSGQRIVIGLFGELKEKKGLHLLIRALRRSGLVERFALLAVGRLSGSDRAILEDAALAPPALLISFAPREELAGLYRACDLVALPSLYDGMPNVMLEAMACGVPAMASTAGGMPDVIEDGETGLLFAAGSWEATARCLERVAEMGRHGLGEMGERAQRLVRERYTPEAEAMGLLDALEGTE